MRGIIVHRGELDAPPGVMLPEEHGLVVDELAALRVDDLPPKVLVLEQIEKVQTHGVLDEAGILGLLPVEQVFQVVDEGLVLEVASLCDNWKSRSVDN